MNQITRSDWAWFGDAGHFICGHYCRFHLCTLVGNYLVSTVGKLWFDSRSREISASVHDPAWLIENSHLKGDAWDSAYFKRFGYEDLGLNRKYETMVFRAGGPCEAEGCNCGIPRIDGNSLDFRGYNDAGDATRGHMDMCEHWMATFNEQAFNDDGIILADMEPRTTIEDGGSLDKFKKLMPGDGEEWKNSTP